MRDVTDSDRARARVVLANALQPVEPGSMLAAMERDPRYHGHAVAVLAQALVAEWAAAAEACAVAYQVHNMGVSEGEARAVVGLIQEGAAQHSNTAAILRAGGAL